MKKLKCIAVIVLLLSMAEAWAVDWYVASGSDGDGTLAKPFDDPQRAIDQASAGDVIHVTQGEYFGKMKVGYLVIDKRGLTLAGGYKDNSFSERNPFTYATIITQPFSSKNSSFDGADIRIREKSGYVDHWSTTVDGFWFDRMKQNSYSPLNAPKDKCPGCLAVPLGSNTKPVIVFEHPDCHIRNCVFMNTALYAVRVTGDGSSIENSLFLNTNYCGIDIFGKGEKIGTGYTYNRILVKNNTFVSAWNARSLERAAGSFLFMNGNADVTVTDNIFHLSNGNSASMGYAVKDERNFNADRWIHLIRNSFSQLRGGIASVYMPDLKASVNFDYVKDLREAPWEVRENDEENPFFKFEKDWFDRYAKAIPKNNPGSVNVNMDDFNKMRSMLGLPPDGGASGSGGAYLAGFYPLKHVQEGGFFLPGNDKLASRGVQAAGPFAIVKAALISGKEADREKEPAVEREYGAIDWNALWTDGESLVGQAVKFKAYYMGIDMNYYGSSSKGNVPYLADTDKNTHIILQLRKAEAMTSKEYPFKGYIARGSNAENYINKMARKPAQDKKKPSDNAFMVYATVKKAEYKVNLGVGPQIVLLIEMIADE